LGEVNWAWTNKKSLLPGDLYAYWIRVVVEMQPSKKRC